MPAGAAIEAAAEGVEGMGDWTAQGPEPGHQSFCACRAGKSTLSALNAPMYHLDAMQGFYTANIMLVMCVSRTGTTNESIFPAEWFRTLAYFLIAFFGLEYQCAVQVAV